VAAQAGELSLEIKRSFRASPSLVFTAFSKSNGLARWWGPQGFTTESLDFDPRVGAPYRIEMRPPTGDSFYLRGEFREVDPPARLVFTFIYEDPHPDDVENVVRLSFRDRDGSTEVDFTQGPFATEERRELHRDGWTDSFDRLAAALRE
jgi:uncharacterized protein YndB with AHSA1/START domain